MGRGPSKATRGYKTKLKRLPISKASTYFDQVTLLDENKLEHDKKCNNYFINTSNLNAEEKKICEKNVIKMNKTINTLDRTVIIEDDYYDDFIKLNNGSKFIKYVEVSI